jgi:hypothetical protein
MGRIKQEQCGFVMRFRGCDYTRTALEAGQDENRNKMPCIDRHTRICSDEKHTGASSFSTKEIRMPGYAAILAGIFCLIPCSDTYEIVILFVFSLVTMVNIWIVTKPHKPGDKL